MLDALRRDFRWCGNQHAEPGDWHAGKDSSAKAKAALKAVKKGALKKERKIRKSVIFHKPTTLKKTREPKYSRTGYVAIASCSHIMLVLHRNALCS